MTDTISLPHDFINTILLIILALIGIFSDFFKRLFKREENNDNSNNSKLKEISEDIKTIKKDIEKRDLIDAMSEMAEVQNSTIQMLAQIKSKEQSCNNQENR